MSLVERERTRLKDLLNKYEPKNLFNMYETALFFKLAPNKTLASSDRSSAGNYTVLIFDKMALINCY